ncbi:MAG: hypothetical protein DCC75_03060 [Proteobacteria bacterium]|nr:MAG: hypothetical protein DCC75_03060 [Pseudomonadota bacterium]
MLRAINDHILKDLSSKIVLLSGPRQAGKTTLAKSLYPEFEYLNYDSKPDQRVIRAQNWGRKKPILILDELHKMKNWKRFLKGIYDTEDLKQKIIVTGSARMEIARRMGDSLAGRHFSYTLYPLTMRELNDETAIDSNFTKLLHLGGFPEPFLKGDEKFAARWRIAHLDIILRQDLLDLEQIRRVGDLETLLDLLRVRRSSSRSENS